VTPGHSSSGKKLGFRGYTPHSQSERERAGGLLPQPRRWADSGEASESHHHGLQICRVLAAPALAGKLDWARNARREKELICRRMGTNTEDQLQREALALGVRL